MTTVETKSPATHGAEKAPASRLISGQKIQLRQDAARVQAGPGQKSCEPLVRVRQSGNGQTTIEVQCACGEAIEIDIQHPAEGQPGEAGTRE